MRKGFGAGDERGAEMEQQIEALLCGRQFKQFQESRVARIKEKYGLRRVDIEILYYLSQCRSHNTSRDIQHIMGLTKGHISQSVDRMQKMRLISFIPDKTDRRYVHFETTAEADAVVREIAKAWSEITEAVFEGVTEEEKKVLLTVAGKIRNNIDRMTRER